MAHLVKILPAMQEQSKVAQSCPTLCDPMDYSPPGSSVHGIFQARVLERVAISFSRGSSQHRDRTWVSCIAGRRFIAWATREVSLETQVQFLGWEDCLAKELANHSSILVWRIPWTEEPGRLQSMGLQRVRHDWVTNTHVLVVRVYHKVVIANVVWLPR